MPEIRITGNFDLTVQKSFQLSDEDYKELIENLNACGGDDREIDNILGEYVDDLNDCCVDASPENFELDIRKDDKWKFVDFEGVE